MLYNTYNAITQKIRADKAASARVTLGRLPSIGTWSKLGRRAIAVGALCFLVTLLGVTWNPLHARELAEEGRTTSSPTLVQPANDTITTGETHPPLGVPTLSWSAVSGADEYLIEISTSAGFADPLVEETTFATSYTPIIALVDGEYFWRVKASIDNEWGAFSDTHIFIKEWDNDGQIIPTLISPANNSVRRAFGHDDFRWTAVPGAAGYLLEIATDTTFSTVIYSEKSIRPSHTPTTHLNNNQYVWRVTAYDNQNNYGAPSTPFSFTFDWDIAPQSISPADNSVLLYSPTLSWSAVEGAKSYLLEIDTEDDFPSPQYCTCYSTNFTWYQNLSNDQEYFWRVKAIDNAGNSSPWSPIRRFRIEWNFEPALLTPQNNLINQSAPYFSWEPIPGAERYQLQVDESTSFDYPKTDIELYNVTHGGITKIKDTKTYIDADYFWRVRGIDAQDNYTPWTEPRTFRLGFETSPQLAYPQPYYEPDFGNLPDARDETIGSPLFVWTGAHKWHPYPFYSIGADYYEITVASDPAFQIIHFQSETASLGAAPTMANPFTNLTDGQIYYWRVRAYIDGAQIGADTTWVTRIDRAASQLPVSEEMTAIHPADGFTAVDTAPVLGWLPIADAHHYRIQLSRAPVFEEITEEALPQFTNYIAGQGQQSRLLYGKYWWRVRAEDAANNSLSEWSELRHFNLAVDLLNANRYDLIPAPYPYTILSDTLEFNSSDELTAFYQSQWTKVATDQDDGLGDKELTDLHVLLNRVNFKSSYPTGTDNYSWVIGFTGAVVPNESVYAIYIDADHITGSGGDNDPLGYEIDVATPNLPEHIIYILPGDSGVTGETVFIFSWTGSSWQPQRSLASIGGDAWHSDADGGIQVLVPYTAIGPGDEGWPGSIALSVVSLSATGPKTIFDITPLQGGDEERILNPVFVSDMIMPLYPFDTPLSNPIVFMDMPALRWNKPYFDSVDGYAVEIARDSEFTDMAETWEINESEKAPYAAMLSNLFQSQKAYGDNESYYWRVRVRHERYSITASAYDYSPWSQAMRFQLSSRQVGNPTVSTGDLADTTPYFYWDRVDGAAGYRIEIDDDANFSDPEFEQNIDSTAYASVGAMWDGTWFWRVAPRRSDKVRGTWTPTMSFTKRSLAPVPVLPEDDTVINQQPIFQWTTILTPTDQPRVSAPAYRLEIDNDPNFSNPSRYETDSTSFVLEPSRSLADGTWYWRVAMIDAADNVGTFSPVQKFYKEYLPPELVGPSQGERIHQATSFEWAPIDGAAYYEFEYADNSLFNQPRSVKTDNTSYTPTRELTKESYWWRVRFYDDDRNPGPYMVGRIEVANNDLFLPFLTQ